MATLGHETVLQRGDGASSEAFTAVADIVEVVPPAISRESVDTTVHNTADRYRTFIPGLRDGGEVTLRIQYDAEGTNHSDLLDDLNDDVLHNYKIVFPTGIGETWTFGGFVTRLGDQSPLDDKITREITFKVSGKPTLAASS
jgi:predicted secreted protein